MRAGRLHVDESLVLPRDVARQWRQRERLPYAFLPPADQEPPRADAEAVLTLLTAEGITMSQGPPPVAMDYDC